MAMIAAADHVQEARVKFFDVALAKRRLLEQRRRGSCEMA
jgi:hypothetical protein